MVFEEPASLEVFQGLLGKLIRGAVGLSCEVLEVLFEGGSELDTQSKTLGRIVKPVNDQAVFCLPRVLDIARSKQPVVRSSESAFPADVQESRNSRALVARFPLRKRELCEAARDSLLDRVAQRCRKADGHIKLHPLGVDPP